MENQEYSPKEYLNAAWEEVNGTREKEIRPWKSRFAMIRKGGNRGGSNQCGEGPVFTNCWAKDLEPL